MSAAAVRDAGDRFDAVTTDPDEVEAAITELLEGVRASLEVAPDDIVDAVETTEAFLTELEAALAAADYDVLTADLSVLEAARADMDVASGAIREFNREDCGFDVDERTVTETGSTVPGFDFSAGSLRDQFVEQLVAAGFTTDEATCLFGEIDFTDPESYTSEEAVTGHFVACGLDIARIGELGVPSGGSS